MTAGTRRWHHASRDEPAVAAPPGDHAVASPARRYLLVFVLALAVRAAVGIVWLAKADDPTALSLPDEQQYWQMAGSLWRGTGLVDELGFRATRMPLYPALLAPFTAVPYGAVAAKAVQWCVGAVAAVLAAALAGAMFDRRVATWAGVLVACDPFLAFCSSLVLTETLYSVSLLALFRLTWPIASAGMPPAEPTGGATGAPRRKPTGGMNREASGASPLEPTGGASPGAERAAPRRVHRRRCQHDRGDADTWRRWLAACVAAVACVYLRESSVGLLFVLGMYVVWARGLRRRVVMRLGVAVVVVVAALMPWAVRNGRVTGDYCLLTHRAGISLYDGVGPQASGASDLGDIKHMPAVAGLSETEWNRYFLDASVRAIRSDPVRILRLVPIKLARMWSPVPNAAEYRSRVIRFAAAAWTIPMFALAVAAVMLWSKLGRGGAHHLVFLVLPAGYLTLLHGVFVGSVRYRLGAIPMLNILVAVVLVGMVHTRRATARRVALRDP
ncbi:MAG: hypothetical protein ACE5E6_05350 [Phycisphaerae bacterium]